jgi:DNA-binding NtrC family response regulator
MAPMSDSDGTVRLESSLSEIVLPGAAIEVASGPDAGARIPIAGRTLRVGAAPDNDLVLSDRSASRHHIEIRIDHDGLWLTDLDSTNGTTVNGVRVARAIIGAGSRIVLGQTTLGVRLLTQPVRIPLSSRRSFGALLGESVAMRELYAVLERVAPAASSVLIEGETGTGKELIASAIHEASPRAEKPFVVVDCGALPPALFESELFGHVRGAFTGADRDRQGLMVAASGGTIFLDEIGELAPESQPKLLRALERKQVRPVGSTTPVDVEVRVIAATHRDLVEEVNRGSFREDLYFRLAVLRIVVPPLRARRDDILQLVELFVTRVAPERAGESAEIARELVHRTFPGNVRELRNAVEERLVLGALSQRPRDVAAADRAALPNEIYRLSYKAASERALEEFQREYVQRLVDRTDGNVSLAAREADMSRRYLQSLIARLGIRVPSG